MDLKQLLEQWEKNGDTPLPAREYAVRLPLHAAARVAALAEMYPLKSEAAIITELLTAALDALEAAFPYQPGDTIVAEDEMGDPIYADTGPTPRFLELSKKHARLLTAATAGIASRD
jgi:hypothetical protein